ncbi:hypothetical protein DNV69_26010 [Salmonella enterica subsp. enterica]|nr:hypothetical protein [Salmonella enterica subsp. enterica serovar Oranienburg]
MLPMYSDFIVPSADRVPPDVVPMDVASAAFDAVAISFPVALRETLRQYARASLVWNRSSVAAKFVLGLWALSSP